jgi:hypothetical protein
MLRRGPLEAPLVPRVAVPGDRRLLPDTNELAAGQAFVHLAFAMSDTKASSEL